MVAKSNTSLTELRYTHHTTHNEATKHITELNKKITDLGRIIIKLKEHLYRHIQQSNESINTLLNHITNIYTREQPTTTPDFHISPVFDDNIYINDPIPTQTTSIETQREQND